MNEFCLACFNGQYPVPIDRELDKFIVERRSARSRTLSEPFGTRVICRIEMK